MESFSKLTVIVLMQTGALCAAALSTLLFLTACGGGGGGVGAPAASGSLDTSFGTNGIVTTPIGSGDNRVNAMAIQGDGRIVTAGYFSKGPDTDFALARYNANGSLDTTFGPSGTGIVTTPIGGANDDARAIAIQGDGKIVVAGVFDVIGTNHIAVARYNADGNLDAAFGTSARGITTTLIGAGSTANAVAIQSDGKIVVAGSTFSAGSATDVVLVRYTADGTRDNGFGTIGIATADLPGIAAANATAVAIQSDGKLVVAGTSRFLGANPNTFVLLRFNTNGSPDNAFGLSGRVFPSIGSNDEAWALAIQSDGKIVVGGGSTVFGLGNYAVARYDTGGNPDTGFGTNGIALAIGVFGSAHGIALQDDGKIVVAGDTGTGSGPDFGLARYNANGGLDTSFGTHGIVTTPVNAVLTDGANAVAIQSDGKIVAAGFTYPERSGSGDFAVARYHR